MPSTAPPPPPLAPPDGLTLALDETHRILTNWGWRQGPCDTRGPRSVRRPKQVDHAVWAACTGDANPHAPKLHEASRAIDVLLALTEQLELPPSQHALADWNNEPVRTLDEVLALLRATATNLRHTPEAFPLLHARLRSRVQATHAEPQP